MSHDSPEEVSDFSDLMRRAAEGDAEAQDRICRHYEPKVRIVARVLLGPALRPHFDSLDLVQSVHRSLLVGLRDQKFDISTPDKLIALASTMVRRKVARKWRSHRREHACHHPQEAKPDEVVATLSALSAPDASPVRIAEYREQLERVCRELNDLERRMLQMRLDGYTSPEVATELGMHPVAIRVRWTRIRQRLDAAGITTDWL